MQKNEKQILDVLKRAKTEKRYSCEEAWDILGFNNTQNPFTLTFGQIPEEYIFREEVSGIRQNLDNDDPVCRSFIVTGTRGCGKTVVLSQLSNIYKEKERWLVVNLASGTDILRDASSEISRLTGLSAQNLSVKSGLREMLQELTKNGIHVLLLLDEITGHEMEFFHEFQIWLREKLDVFLIMVGINVCPQGGDDLFLYHVPKVMLKPLNIPAIAARYKSIFEILPENAVAMAKLTKGYAFAFQLLGDLVWRRGCITQNVIDEYSELLFSYSYERIWLDLSEEEKEVCQNIANGARNEEEISSDPGIQRIDLCVKRLINRGIIKKEIDRSINFELPLFEKYIRQYGI